jgi:biotin transport system substrate-specific component
LGPKLSSLAVGLYLILGALGLPIFSDGGSGIEHLTGISGGYLFGFPIAACFMGVCKNAGLLKKFTIGFACLLMGHALILTCGWAWMSTQVGMASAYRDGVAPFYLGSVAKSLIALLVLKAVESAKDKIKIR